MLPKHYATAESCKQCVVLPLQLFNELMAADTSPRPRIKEVGLYMSSYRV